MKRKDISAYDVFCGIDVGKDLHCARVLGADGETCLAAREVAQDEGELASFFRVLAGLGRALVVVDQRGGFGSLVVTCAAQAGLDVACIPPRRFSQVAELSGEDKTDASDALALARLPLEAPRHLDVVGDAGDGAEEARVLLRYRQDAVRERTRAYDRVHDALNRCCPALERLLSGSALHTRVALAVLSRYGVLGLASARAGDVSRWVSSQRGLGASAADAAAGMWEAARSQRARMPACGALDLVVRTDCARMAELEELDDELAARVSELCAGVEEVAILSTMDGVGEVYSRTIALEVGDVSRFEDHNRLASYAGVGKCARDSGRRHGRKRRRSYNRRLRNALFESARIAIRRPGPDLDYYERKLAGDMNAHQALHALVRKRVAIMYAMLKNKEPYRAA